jgi:hypothetical protein
MQRDVVDESTTAFYLQVPPTQVVVLQALFESYEGVGIVRTMDVHSSVVSILTTPAMADTCEKILASVQKTINWKELPASHPVAQQLREGDFKRTF